MPDADEISKLQIIEKQKKLALLTIDQHKTEKRLHELKPDDQFGIQVLEQQLSEIGNEIKRLQNEIAGLQQ